MSIDFKGSHYPKDVILYAVFFWFCRKVFSGLNRAAFRKVIQPSWQIV